MEFKHRAGPYGLAGHQPPHAPIPCGVVLTATSGPSLPHQLPLPRAPLQEAERVVCSYPLASRPPPQVLVATPAPVTSAVLPRMEESVMLHALSAMFGKPCPDLRPDTLYALAVARATGLDATGFDGFVERVIIRCSGCLSGRRLAAVVAGLVSVLPDEAARQRCRDRIAMCLLSPSRGYRPGDIARLTTATALAWGGGAMSQPDFEAFARLLARAAGELGPAQVCEIIDGLCASLGGPSMDLSFVQGLVQSLCAGVDALEDPWQARRLMRQMADALGGEAMTQLTRGFLLDLLVDAPSLDLEQMGHMLLGLADSLDASSASCARDTKAAAKAGAKPGLPSLSHITGPAAEMGLMELVRWCAAIAVAVRGEGTAGIQALGRALCEAGIYFEPRQLTAVGCGMAAGLGDGLLGDATRATLVQLSGLADLDQRRALNLGLKLAQDPLGAASGHEDELELLELAWQLPNVLNARTAPVWFGQIHDGKAPPADRAQALALLARHGARHLSEDHLRQARDLALAHAPQQAASIQGAWMERGLPQALFDRDLPLPPGLPVYRAAMAQRLARAQEELRSLDDLPCAPAVRQQLRTVLHQSVACLQRGLEAVREQESLEVSAPAVR